jgi:hypothetical protein
LTCRTRCSITEDLIREGRDVKALKMLLESEGVSTKTLRVLFEQDGATTFSLTSDGYDVLDLWVQLRDLAPKTGRWPLLVTDDYPTNRAHRYVGGKEPKKPHYNTYLKEAEGIDFGAWLKQEHEEHLETVRREAALDQPELHNDDVGYFRDLLKGDEEFHGIIRGKWPKAPSHFCFEAIAAPVKFTEDMKPRKVKLALLPAPEGWKAPAFMTWGGWNGSPGPALHCAAMRYWEQTYGAEVVALTSDEWEARVLRPPQTRKEALRLAKDHFHYCQDRVNQQEESLDALASKLYKADAWYFWWD